ncbi:MAG: glycosyltransferase family 10 [Patescibacteria group bacterium]|jgi:hypothetical protein
MTEDKRIDINKKIKVKISTNFQSFPIVRQTPESRGAWKNYQFYINDNIQECDWWVVFNGLEKKEKAECPLDNTILITGEPTSKKKYEKKFLDQFNYIITCQQGINHNKKILTQQSLPWLVGGSFIEKSRRWENKFSKDYDELASMRPFDKTKNISAISSSKNKIKGHQQRLKFVLLLKKILGDKLDLFGVGNNTIADKWDGIAPYKYSIVIENSSEPHYWTEKLSDAFLAQSFPLYYGCPNIYDYFPKNSLAIIDINKPEEAISQINKIIADNTYEKSLPDILKAKDLILNKYNLFPSLVDFINKLPQQGEKQLITLYPEVTKSSFIKKIRNMILKIIGAIKRMLLKNAYINELIWRINGKPVPPPQFIKQRIIKNYAKKFDIKIFIETGTYQGDTVMSVKNKFNKIYSIELNQALFEKAQNRFVAYPHIHILQGDSPKVLPSILSLIDEPALFWLDGHYSGGITSKGNLNTPIIEELKLILSHKIKNHIILIDDARCFTGNDDYPTIIELESFVKKADSKLNFKIDEDIIRIIN